MTYESQHLIERQIVEILEHGNYRAQILRNHGFVKEADEEFATVVLTALILTRAYCVYEYLDKSICIELDKLLGFTLAVYIATYKINVEESIFNHVYALWKQQNEELVAVTT